MVTLLMIRPFAFKKRVLLHCILFTTAMMNLTLGLYFSFAGMAVAIWRSDVSDKDLSHSGPFRLVPRTNSRSPSPTKSASSSRSKSPVAQTLDRLGLPIASSSRLGLPSHRDGPSSSSQVLKKAMTVPPLGNLRKSPNSSVIRKQALPIAGKNPDLAVVSGRSSRVQQLKRVNKTGAQSLAKSLGFAAADSTDSLQLHQLARLNTTPKGKYSALVIANGPASLEAAVLGETSTIRMVRPGRTEVLSIAHNEKTVWATGNSGKGASAVAAASGDGVITSAAASYMGKGFIKTYGPEGHDTHTVVHPGKKEEQQWEARDPSTSDLGATVVMEGQGHATAGGLSLKQPSQNKS